MDERLPELTVRDLVARLATGDPVPGGGSAAALAGALGAALMSMVVELTAGRPDAAAHTDTLTEIATAATTWRSELLNLAELDANAYLAVVRARRLPRDTERDRETRAVQVAAAVREATRVPLATARGASDVLALAERLGPLGSRNAISDVGVGALLAAAAIRGAALNVQINLPSLTDEQLRSEAQAGIADLLDGLDQRTAAVLQLVQERLG
jgi:glutamate formiminotransferase/formiminotetrahydrofolate cyclodeaminase